MPWQPPAGQRFACFTPDGRWLVTRVPPDRTLRYWRLGSWRGGPTLPRTTLPRPGGIDTRPLPSPDGKLMLWMERTVPVLDAGTGQVLAALRPPRDADVVGYAFSPDGACLAVATGNHMIHIWDLRAVRRGLAEVGLDWDLPPYPAADAGHDRRKSTRRPRTGGPPPRR